ncbi:glycosyltransferase [Mangrovimicrobium sediminis]|uniref:Glycosyltransferase n=1 Tax=Mangrovimicrobium sediminis TaxID=2562682 RepID=A0A4Z0M0Z3_9GAMM|nr:glycosyltransferase family 4 protein [Haliea sp. SAOS-164]TGD73116.1 glycosyltransferase [Haliea sp. SAOS-164]
MNIMIIANHLQQGIGGIEIQCDLIARHFARFGHSVTYLATAAIDQAQTTEYQLQYCDLRDATALRDCLREQQPDIIYFRHNKNKLHRVARIAHDAGIPLVYAVSSLQDVTPWAYHHSDAALTPRRIASIAWQRVKSRWNWRGLRLVSGAVSLNPDYTQRLPVANRVTIRDAMASDCEPFDWPRPCVLWVAQLKDYKQPEAYVELARRCTDLDLDFLMIGGIARERYRWIARGEGTPPNLHYLGERSPALVNGALRASLALVHTCLPEGFGNNFIQAWLQGRPTLSLQFDPAGIIEGEGLGRVPGDLDGLERALRELLAQPEDRAAMGERALAYAREHFDPVTNTRRLEAFLERTRLAHGAAQ